MDPDKRAKDRDPAVKGEPPTLSGYRAYAERLARGDRTVETEAHRQWQENWFQPKPAIVHYDQLHRDEQKLAEHTAGKRHGGGDIEAFLQSDQPHFKEIEDPAERRKNEDFLRDRYAEWNQARQALNEQQHADFNAAVAQGVEDRQNQPGNIQTPDQSAFFAHGQVVSGYCIQHEDNNSTLDSALARDADPIQKLLDEERQLMARNEDRQPDRGGWER